MMVMPARIIRCEATARLQLERKHNKNGGNPADSLRIAAKDPGITIIPTSPLGMLEVVIRIAARKRSA